ncbi:MAG: glycerophosphodiester phosphodiesterase [Haloarculaceae archaeon]
MELIGHRGCGSQYPENTVQAVRKAGQYLQTVEIDVRRCASGELVVFHDETVDRLTGGSGAVADLSWTALRELEVLDSGESIPRLSAVLEAVPAGVTAQIELKESDIAADVRDVVTASAVDAHVTSFSPDALASVADLSWSVPTGYLFESLPTANIETAIDLECEYVHPHFDLCLETDVVEAAHDRGLSVIAWKAAKTSEDVARVREAGVDGITADRWDIA